MCSVNHCFHFAIDVSKKQKTMEENLKHHLNIVKEKSLTRKAILDSFSDEKHKDVKFVLSNFGGELYANKSMLTIRSAYFEAMFNADSQFKENETGVVEIQSTMNVMKMILELVYTGEIMDFKNLSDSILGLRYCDASPMELMESLNLMRMFLMDAFKDYKKILTDFFKANTSSSLLTLLPMLIKATNLKLDGVTEAIHKAVASNYSSVTEPGVNEFIQLMQSDIFVEQILTKVQEDYAPNLEKEKERFEFYRIWSSKNKGTLNQEQIYRIRQSFNLGIFTIEDLLGPIRDSGLFEEKEIFRIVSETGTKYFQASVKLREENETLKRKHEEEIEKNKKLKTTLENVRDKIKKIYHQSLIGC